MTVVIMGTLDTHCVAELAASLRRRGFAVLALESMRLAALVMLTERVVALIAHQRLAPADWESGTSHLSGICPATKILFVANGDPRTAEQLAREVARHVDGGPAA
jgi:hypothetical protein